ncbi:MAG: hypothetical protein MJZ29_07750 [Bacteroidaceae bacterium]|nr:hypothetical protein [Bacteroidaceae bacterium]
MKKYLLAFSTMLCMCFTFVACGGDDDDVPGSGGEEGGGTVVVPSGKVDPAKEKQYIESVGQELAKLFRASDFQDIADMANELDDIEGDDVFEDFIETTEKGYDEIDLIKLANIKGSFVGSFKNKSMKRTSSTGDLNISYTASDNKQWVLSVSHSGNLGTVTLDEEWDYHYSDGHYNEYITTTKMEIPKTVKAKLTKANETVAEVNLTINSLTITDGEPSQASKASYTLSSKVKDFEVTSNSEYNPGGKTIVKANVKKGKTNVATVTVEGNSSLSKGEISNGNVTSLNVCILDKLNVKGNINDIKSLADALEEAEDNDENETTFDRWLKNANSYIDLGLYNNNSTKQASIIFGKDADKDYWGGSYHTYYEIVPMIEFTDGTSYSFEEYFDEKTFKSLMDEVDKIINEFEKLVD